MKSCIFNFNKHNKRVKSWADHEGVLMVAWSSKLNELNIATIYDYVGEKWSLATDLLFRLCLFSVFFSLFIFIRHSWGLPLHLITRTDDTVALQRPPTLNYQNITETGLINMLALASSLSSQSWQANFSEHPNTHGSSSEIQERRNWQYSR